jgi:nucleoside-diphosphate-sugar epimerase
MNILITGGAGFLGRLLTRRLLAEPEAAVGLSLTLADVVATDAWANDPRVRSVACDISDAAAIAPLVTADTGIIYHLAAVVSGQAEREFDLGMKVNLDSTRVLLELARHAGTCPKFIFTSSIAVFGGALPEVVGDQTAVTPQGSYGAAKAMGELLVNDYSRRGYVDGRVFRLPTISVRPGKPNQAASSFASGIIREPLNGQPAICPVEDRKLRLWLSSPRAAVANLARAAKIPGSAFGIHRMVNLPGLSVTVGEMMAALEKVAGKKTVERVKFERVEAIERLVVSWPGRFDLTRALALGFEGDANFETIIRNYLEDEKIVPV